MILWALCCAGEDVDWGLGLRLVSRTDRLGLFLGMSGLPLDCGVTSSVALALDSSNACGALGVDWFCFFFFFFFFLVAEEGVEEVVVGRGLWEIEAAIVGAKEEEALVFQDGRSWGC